MNQRIKVSDKLKLNNKARFVLVLVGILMFGIGSAELYDAFTRKVEVVTEQKEIYKYTNKFSSNYAVNIKSNPYIEEQIMLPGQTYISDLVSSLDISLNYSYSDTAEEPVPVKYNYKVDTVMVATYEADDKEYVVLNKKENLKTVGTLDAKSDKLKIEEVVNVDFSKYHEIIKDFKQTMGMNVKAKLNVVLTVDTAANIESQTVNNQYKSEFSIDLGSKIAVVENKGTDTDTKSIKSKATTEEKVDFDAVKASCSVAVIILGIYIIYAVAYRTQKLRVIGNDFKAELNRILKSCQDRVVVVENQVDTDVENTIMVSKFGELIKLSEELYKPILCWIEKDEKEAQFSIISNRVRYLYVLKQS